MHSTPRRFKFLCIPWCSNNSLILNANKCQKVSFSRKKSVISFDYSINNTYIDNLNSIKDFGVIFYSVFTFNDHIHFIYQKANNCNVFDINVSKLTLKKT